MSAPVLPIEEMRFLNFVRGLEPDARKAMMLAGRAMLASTEAKELASEADALVPGWGPKIAVCMREDADRLDPPSAS